MSIREEEPKACHLDSGAAVAYREINLDESKEEFVGELGDICL